MQVVITINTIVIAVVTIVTANAISIVSTVIIITMFRQCDTRLVGFTF